MKVRVWLDYCGHVVEAIVSVPEEYAATPFQLQVKFRNLLETQPRVLSMEKI
jgi:hypothetical protein